MWKMSDDWGDCHWSHQRFCRRAHQHRIRQIFQNYWFTLFNVGFQSCYRSSCSNYCHANDFENTGTKYKWYCVGIIFMFTLAQIRWFFKVFIHRKSSPGILVKVSGRYIPEVFIYLLSVISLAFEIDERPKRIFPSFKLAKLKFGKTRFDFSSKFLFLF